MDPLLQHQGRAPEVEEPETDRWTVPDLIDFDYFVEEDERQLRESPSERKRLVERDRRLYRDKIEHAIATSPEHGPHHRSRALRRWLTFRRRAEDPTLRPLLPGEAFARGQRLVTAALGIFGFAAGVGVASALLRYEGDHPVNVSWYLFVLVLLQILLVVTALVAWYGRRTSAARAAMQDFSLIGHLVRPVFARAARWVQRQRLAHLPPDVRDRAEAKKGLLESHYALYGPASYLPMLIPAQVFGIGFNLGAIVVTLALNWFTDLAFGWGSALNVSPQVIHTVSHAIALPWSWLFGEGVGVPTLEQIAGTRIALKDPLSVLQAENLRSWRWFLVLAVFTYGLLPRLVMLGLSVLKQRRALARLPFTHQRTQALYARMITPSLDTASGITGAGAEMPIPAPLKPLTAPPAAPRPQPPAAPEPAPAPAPSAEAKPPLAPPSEPVPSKRPETTPAPERAPKPATPAKPEAKPEPERPPAKSPTMPAREPTAPPQPTPVAEPPPLPRAETQPEAETPPPPAAETKSKPKVAEQPKPAPAPPAATRPPGGIGALVAPDACVLLIHLDVADVLEEPDHARLQQLLLQHAGWRVAASATFGGGRAMADQAIRLIAESRWQAPPARVALLADGSQPPITESLRFLRAVRAAAGEHAPVLLTLVGDPEGGDPLPPISAFDFADWERKIEQMGDPYLRLEMLAGPAEDA